MKKTILKFTCEPLEQRRLLSANLAITLNNSPVPSTIDFGHAILKDTEPTKTIKITNNGSSSISFAASIFSPDNQQTASDHLFEIVSATDSSNLAPKATATVVIGMRTGFAEARQQVNFSLNFSDQSNYHVAYLQGEVDLSVAGNYSSLGAIGTTSLTKTGAVTGRYRQDQDGSRVIQDTDALYGFSLATQTSVTYSLRATTSNTDVSATILPDYSNGNGHSVTVQDLNNYKKSISNSSDDASASSATTSLSPGYYFFYVTSIELPQRTNSDGDSISAEGDFTLKLNTIATAPGQLLVTGTNNATIASGDNSPTTTDGTSFGEVTAGTPETLTFTVKNSGGSSLNIDKSKAIVSGDFEQASALPSSLGPNQTATFSVTPINTDAGTKNGTISIASDVGTYTFAVNGIYDRKKTAGNLVVTSLSGVTITSGDISPTTADGTSFSTATTGTPETLTFVVTNTGQTDVTINTSQALVTGDFQQVDGLPNTIAAGASANFSVSPVNTDVGSKSGTVTIISDVGNYSFAVGGTFTPKVTAPVTPKPQALVATVSALIMKKASVAYSFSVTYSTRYGIDVSTLDDHDVQVKGPNGYVQWARFNSLTTSKNGSVTVVYHLHAASAAWTKASNGSYKIYLRSGYTGGIKDQKGNLAEFLDSNGAVLALKAAASFDVAIK